MNNVQIKIDRANSEAVVTVAVPLPSDQRLDEMHLAQIRGKLNQARCEDCIADEILVAAGAEIRAAREAIKLSDDQIDALIQQQTAKLERLKARPARDPALGDLARVPESKRPKKPIKNAKSARDLQLEKMGKKPKPARQPEPESAPDGE